MSDGTNIVSLIVEVSAEDAKRLMDEFGAKVQANVGKKGKDATEAGRLGFFALGNAVEDFARSAGVAGQASRQMGNSIERVAASALPGLGAAVGVVVLAVTSAVAMYSRLSEETKKLSDGAQEYTMKMLAQRDKTEALAKAEYVLFRQRWAEEQENIRKRLVAIDEETAGLKKRRSVIEKNTENQDHLDSFTAKTLGDITMRIGGYEREKDKLVELAKARGLDFEAFKKQLFGESAKKEKAADVGMIQPGQINVNYAMELANKQVAAEAAAAQLSLEAAKGRGASMEEIWEKELVAFDSVTAAKIAMAKTLDDSNQVWADREVGRQNMVLKNTRSTEKMKQQAAQQTLDHGANAFKMLADMGGTYGRAAFLAYQVAAIGKTVMATRTAAMAAYEPPPIGFGPAAGSVLAGAIILEGAASIATIAMQKYEGGGGMGGGGATGTYNASPSTGLPENGGYKFYGYEQSNYGTGWRPGEGPSGPTIIVQGDVYAQDGAAFSKKVNKAVQQDIKDRGDTAKVIERYI